MAITKIREAQIKNISRNSETITQASHGFTAQHLQQTIVQPIFSIQ